MTIDFWADFDASYLPVSVLSCIICLIVFRYVSPLVTSWIFPGLKDLPQKKQLFWHTSVCSTLHAVVVSSLCVIGLFSETHLFEDPVWGHSPMVRCSTAIVAGYLVADCLLIIAYYHQIGDVFYLAHHLSSIFAYIYVMSYGVYAFFANYRLMAEFSTPCVNNRWFLDTMDKKSTKVHFYNGVILTGIFFLCRILAMPLCWYMIYSIYGTEPFERTLHSKYVLVGSCFCLDVLNIYWFYKLLKGVHKTIKSMNATKDVTRQKGE